MHRSPSILNDTFRRLAVLIAAIAQPIVTIRVFSGRDYGELLGPATTQPPIVPASYAFMIWTAIFAGSLVYAIYQALPAQRESPLLRAVGWHTASAFLATNLWLVAAAFQHVWLTFACIVWILLSLVAAFRILGRTELTPLENQFVLVPISIFLGWVSVSTFANFGSAAKQSGWANTLVPEAVWSILLLIASGALILTLLRASGANRWYAGAAVWALVAIVVANTTGGAEAGELAVAITAGGVAVAVGLATALWSLSWRTADD